MLRHESEDMDLAEDPEKRMLRHGSGDMDLAKDPPWWMLRHEPDTWIRRHGSCRESMRDKDAETWVRRRGFGRGSILVDAKTWIGDMAPAEECRGSWDAKCTEDTGICLVNNFHAICGGGSYWEADVKDPLLISSYTLFGVACLYNFKHGLLGNLLLCRLRWFLP